MCHTRPELQLNVVKSYIVTFQLLFWLVGVGWAIIIYGLALHPEESVPLLFFRWLLLRELLWLVITVLHCCRCCYKRLYVAAE